MAKVKADEADEYEVGYPGLGYALRLRLARQRWLGPSIA